MIRKPLSKTAFREALIRHRDESGLTLEAVARGSNVPLATVGKLCRREGKQTSAENALQIAQFFGMTLEEFVGMAQVDDDAQILRIVRRLDPETKDILLRQMRGLVER